MSQGQAVRVHLPCTHGCIAWLAPTETHHCELLHACPDLSFAPIRCIAIAINIAAGQTQKQEAGYLAQRTTLPMPTLGCTHALMCQVGSCVVRSVHLWYNSTTHPAWQAAMTQPLLEQAMLATLWEKPTHVRVP
jgi:hypothetical protein